MKEPTHDPRRLDVRRFAADAARLEGTLSASQLPRLSADTPLVDAPAAWSLAGESRSRSGGPAEIWLRLSAQVQVVLTCQRCLQPIAATLASDRDIRFVADEDEAARLDEAGDDDVLAWPPGGRVDALALVEDELILSLPIVPRHEICPQPLALPDTPPEASATDGGDATGDDAAGRQNPFAVLAQLKGLQGHKGRPPGKGGPDGGRGS